MRGSGRGEETEIQREMFGLQLVLEITSMDSRLAQSGAFAHEVRRERERGRGARTSKVHTILIQSCIVPSAPAPLTDALVLKSIRMSSSRNARTPAGGN